MICFSDKGRYCHRLRTIPSYNELFIHSGAGTWTLYFISKGVPDSSVIKFQVGHLLCQQGWYREQ